MATFSEILPERRRKLNRYAAYDPDEEENGRGYVYTNGEYDIQPVEHRDIADAREFAEQDREKALRLGMTPAKRAELERLESVNHPSVRMTPEQRYISDEMSLKSNTLRYSGMSKDDPWASINYSAEDMQNAPELKTEPPLRYNYITNIREEIQNADRKKDRVLYIPSSKKDREEVVKKYGVDTLDMPFDYEAPKTTQRAGRPPLDREAFREELINQIGIDPRKIDPEKEGHEYAAGYASSNPNATAQDIERVRQHYFNAAKEKKAALEKQIEEGMKRFDKEADRLYNEDWWYRRQQFKESQKKEKEKTIPTAMFNEVEDLLSRKWFRHVTDWGSIKHPDYKMVPGRLSAAQKEAYDRNMLDAQAALKQGLTPAEAVDYALQRWQQDENNPVNIARRMGGYAYDLIYDKQNERWIEGFKDAKGNSIPYEVVKKYGPENVRIGPDGKIQVNAGPARQDARQENVSQGQGMMGPPTSSVIKEIVINPYKKLFAETGNLFTGNTNAAPVTETVPPARQEMMNTVSAAPSAPESLGAKYNNFINEVLPKDQRRGPSPQRSALEEAEEASTDENFRRVTRALETIRDSVKQGWGAWSSTASYPLRKIWEISDKEQAEKEAYAERRKKEGAKPWQIADELRRIYGHF